MSGHDYRNTGKAISAAYGYVINDNNCKVKLAVDRFISKHKYELNIFKSITGRGWWFIKK